MEKGKYIYGIIGGSEERKFGRVGIGGQEVYAVCYRDVTAVISDLNIARLDVTRENALVHEGVLREVMESYAVIPMSFGTVAEDEKDVRKILKWTYGEAKDALKKIYRKVQIDVKASWDMNTILRDILNEDKDIQRLKEAIAAKPPNETYNDKIELGRAVKSALDRKKSTYIKEMHRVLSKLAEDSCANKLVDERMIMNTSFLVKEEREREFYDKVDGLEEKYGGKVEVISIGPLPAYDFARIEVGEMDFERIDEARRLFGLGEEATLAEIKAVYHDLVHKYHPDQNPDHLAKEEFKKIERAYTMLSNYCEHYPCSFRKEYVEKTIVIGGEKK